MNTIKRNAIGKFFAAPGRTRSLARRTFCISKMKPLAQKLSLIWLILLLLVGCSEFPLFSLSKKTSQKTNEPLAMLIVAGGSATVQQGARTRPIKPNLLPFPLCSSDVVYAGKEKTAWLICSNDRQLSVAVNRSLTVSQSACKKGTQKPAGTFKAVQTQAGQPVSTPRGGVIPSGPREGEGDYGRIPVVLSPRNTALLDPRPTIRWTEVDGAKTYLVAVKGPEGAIIDNLETTAIELRYPLESPSLQTEFPYFIQVSTRTGPTEPLRKSETISVTLLLPERADQAAAFAAALEQEPFDEATKHYLMGGYYATLRLDQLAIAEYQAVLETQPALTLAHQALGNLYLRIGLIRDAFPHYTQALELAQTNDDLPGQAAAHVGLGQAEYNWEHRDKALNHFEAALALYQEAELETQVAELQQAIETLQGLQRTEGPRWSYSDMLPELLVATSPSVEQRIRADLAFAEAERLLEAGERDAAIACWLEAAALYQELDRLREADAYLAIANAYSPFPVGQAPDLTGFLKKFLQDPTQLLSDILNSKEYYLLAMQGAMEVYEELCAVQDCFPKLNEKQLEAANALYQQGMAAYEEGRYENAISALQDAAGTYKAAGYPPGQLRALVGLSRIYSERNSLLGAFDAFLTIIQAIPILEDLPVGNVTDEHYLEGLHIYEQGNFEEAIAIWNEVIHKYEEENDVKQVAVTRTNLGNAYAELGDYPQSLALYAQALSTFETLEDLKNQATVHHNWGATLLSQGRYTAALTQLESALSLWRATGYLWNEAASLDALGFVMTQLGHNKEAETYLDQALVIHRQLNDRPGEADALNNLGNLEVQRGRYAQAEDYFKQVLAIWRQEYDNSSKELKTLSNLAGAQSGAGRVDEALATFDEAWHLADLRQDRLARALILDNRGNLYANLGDIQTALNHHHQALRIFEEYGKQDGVAAASTKLGQAYLMVGDLRRAQGYLERALEAAEATGHQMNIANAEYVLGVFWFFLPNHSDQAGIYLHKALYLWEDLESLDGQVLALIQLAYVYEEQGHHDEALAAETRALELAAEIENQLFLVQATVGMGWIQAESGEIGAARAAFEQAYLLAVSTNNVRGEFMALIGKGYVAIKEENHAAALSAFQQAIDCLERWHGLLTIPELKTTFLANLADFYDLAAYLAYQQNQPDLAFEYLEQSKARALLEQLANLSLRPSPNLDPNLAEREARLRGEINRLFKELEKAQAQSPPDQDRLDNLGVQLEAHRRAYADLLLEIQIQDPTYQAWRHPTVLTLAEIQAKFLAGQEITLVEYAVSPLGASAWVVEGENATPVALDVDEANLKDRISYWHELVGCGDRLAQTVGRQLYDLIFAPLRPYIHHDRLVIIPHGSLHGLAFAALYDGAHYLVEDYIISYLLSASMLAYLPGQSATPGNQALILGNADGSLEHAAAEAQAVAALYGVTPLLREQATERSVKERGGSADLLHFAVHGAYQPLSPLFSRLELADGEGEDGLLEVHEIYNLDLAETDLVVLSACRTQEGEISGGDEVSALSRAFLYAGAPLVVGSLWAVDDPATADLMVAFHQGVQKGEEAAISLRNAQQQMLANPNTAHPYYWAAFGLTGRPEQIFVASLPASASDKQNVDATPADSGDDTEAKGGGICGTSVAAWPLLMGSVLALSSMVRRERGNL